MKEDTLDGRSWLHRRRSHRPNIRMVTLDEIYAHTILKITYAVIIDSNLSFVKLVEILVIFRQQIKIDSDDFIEPTNLSPSHAQNRIESQVSVDDK